MSVVDLDSGSKEEIEAEESSERVPPPVPEEDLLFTPEEKAERERYRLSMSQCCVDESWGFYRKVTEAPEKPIQQSTQSLALEEVRRASSCILYDPTLDQRRAYLKKKYAYLHHAFSLDKEAPAKPYIRPTPPRELDLPGQRLYRPAIVQVQRPEIDVEHIHPSTVATTERSVKVTNRNFTVEDDDVLNKRTQTDPAMTRGASLKSGINTDRTGEDFDYQDIPLDDQGNPIGKRTGYCEWCGKEILPIPTPHVLRTTWDRRRLYCCRKYRQLMDEAMTLEEKLRKKIDDENFFVNIKPSPSIHTVALMGKDGQGKKGKHKKGQPDGEEEMAYAEEKEKRKQERIAIGKMALVARKAEQDRKELLRRQGMKDKQVDTDDLPWDPYESRFGHPKLFNDEIFDDSSYHCYPHADIVFKQTEMYEDVATMMHPDKVE